MKLYIFVSAFMFNAIALASNKAFTVNLSPSDQQVISDAAFKKYQQCAVDPQITGFEIIGTLSTHANSCLFFVTYLVGDLEQEIPAKVISEKCVAPEDDQLQVTKVIIPDDVCAPQG